MPEAVAPSGPGSDDTNLAGLLDRLGELLERSSFEARDAAGDLATACDGTSLAEEAARLERLVSRYDFGAAQRRLEKLRRRLSGSGTSPGGER